MTLGIRSKLLAAFAVVALFTGVLGWFAVTAMEHLEGGQRTLYGDVFGGTHLLASWIDAAWESRSDLLAYLLADDPAQRDQLRTRMVALDATLDDLARQMDAADTDRQDIEPLGALTAAWRSYTDWRDRAIVSTVESGDRAAALSAYQVQVIQHDVAIDAAIDAFLARKRQVGTSLAVSGETTYNLTRAIALGLAVGAPVLGLLIGFFLSRSITGPARQVATAARGLARGDVDQQISADISSGDELGQMVDAFREVIRHEQAMVATADAIARGDLTREVEPRSGRDALGSAFQRMSANLRALLGERREAVQRASAQARLAADLETRIRAVMSSVADGILTLDKDGVIESVNPAGEQIFGYAAAEIVGQPLARLMPEALPADSPARSRPDDHPTSPALEIGDRREVTGYYKDGSPLCVELTLSEARLDGRRLQFGVVRDITDRKRADQRRGVQHAISSSLAGARTLDDATSGILRAIGQGFDWQLGVFWTVDQAADVLRCHTIWRAPHVAAEAFVALTRQTTVERGAGLPGRAWDSRQPVSVSDIPEAPPVLPRLEAATREGLHGTFAFPIAAGSEVLGVIELFSHRVRPTDLDLILTVTSIGQQIGQFIERERAEEAVHESEARKRAMLEGALDGVITMDHQGKIIEFNAAAEQTLGYRREAVLGQNLADLLVPPALRAAHRAGLARYLATGEGPMLNKRLEVSALRADGSEFPAELSVTPIATGGPAVFTSFLRDITGRKQAEQEIRALNAGLEERVSERTAQLEAALAERKWAAETLERMQRRNELILTSAGEGIYGVDHRGWATFVNPAAAAMTGYTVEQLVNRPLHEVLRHSAPDGTSYARTTCPVCAVERDGSERRTADGVFWRQDGTSFPVSYTSTPIREQSAIVGAVVTFQDTTERRAMDRMKDEFVSMVSHEIRTPMNGVLGMVELLLETPLDARQREYADAVRRSGETLLAIVNDILDSAKIEAGKLELDIGDLDVRAVAEDVVGLFAAQAQQKGLEIGCLVHRDVPRGLLGDPGRLRQILLNLVGNAVKFTEQGEVVVHARLARQARSAAVVRFEVTDTGPGIAPEAAQRIFQPFSQADRATTRQYGGTGLGLTISKRLVELMGGEIGVSSELGRGSTFWFTARLPRQRTRSPRLPSQLHDLRVLVVDDSADTRDVLEEHLTTWGVAIDSVEAGPQAIEVLRAAVADEHPFDLVLLDRHLPGMDGLELAHAIRADPQLAATRLVLLSPLVESPLPADAEALGVAAWLTKPVRQSQLFDTLVSIASGVTELPAGATATEQRDQGAATGVAEPGGPRILVVEDTPINQQVARGMLARLGYTADLASDGLEALELLNRQAYAAILMDCQMPRMDGFEASREIRKREGATRHTPIIAMTASAMRGERDRCLAAGMDDYVAKPVRLQELQARLRRWSGASAPDTSSAWASGQRRAVPGRARAEAAGVDPKVLLGLREFRSPGEPDPVARLVELFLREAPSRLARMQASLEQADASAVRASAHALRGSAGTLGVHSVQDLCADLEVLAESGRLAGAGEVLQALRMALERVGPALEELQRAEASPRS